MNDETKKPEENSELENTAAANTDLLKILDGNVKEIKAKLKKTAFSKDELEALLQAENDGNTRSGVVDAINALLNPPIPSEEKPTRRTIKDVMADLEKAEEGPTDVVNANRIKKHRAELADLKAKK